MLLACIDLTKYLENRMTFVVVVQETARKCWKNQCYQVLSFKSSTADRHLLLVNLSLVSWVTVEGCLLTDQCRHFFFSFFFFILKPVLSVTLASTLHIFYLDIKNTIQSLCCKKISTKILCCQMFFPHSSGAVWEWRWTSWAVRPNEPSGFRGRKDLLHRASALVTTCP